MLHRFLDIYSPSPIARSLVLLLFAGAVVLLANNSPSAAIPILLLVWVNRDRFLATVAALLDRRAWLVVALPLLVVVARSAWPLPAAPDDLLRHIAVAFWEGGYPAMYTGTDFPAAGLYPLFDAAVGALARASSAPVAMWITQAGALALFAWVLVRGASACVAGHPNAPYLVSAALICTLGATLPRIAMARPEMFVAIWALAACLVRTPRQTLVWVGAGALMNAAYWLSPVYFPAVILMHRPLRVRVWSFVALSACWVAVWLWIAGAELLATMRWQFMSMTGWVAGISVGENLSIVNALGLITFWPLLLGAVWIASLRSGRTGFLWLALWFALSNQIRYVGVIAPLLALFVLSGLPRRDFLPGAQARLAAFASAVVLAASAMLPLHRYAELPSFTLPEGAVVFTHFDEATYSLPFHNLGRISVAPSFALGALDTTLQQAVRDLIAGRLDCETLLRARFTHVVERTLRGAPPACAELLEAQGKWRLWALDRAPAQRARTPAP